MGKKNVMFLEGFVKLFIWEIGVEIGMICIGKEVEMWRGDLVVVVEKVVVILGWKENFLL